MSAETYCFRKLLQAEYHRVLYQSYEYFPYVSHLFTGPQMGIWAVINPSPPQTCNKNNTDEILKVKARIVKLLRFNNQKNNI